MRGAVCIDDASTMLGRCVGHSRSMRPPTRIRRSSKVCIVESPDSNLLLAPSFKSPCVLAVPCRTR
eukprot:9471905-Pyramimonas_sp.AAC.1